MVGYSRLNRGTDRVMNLAGSLVPRVITLLVGCAGRVVIAGGNNNPRESWFAMAYPVIRDFSLPLSLHRPRPDGCLSLRGEARRRRPWHA